MVVIIKSGFQEVILDRFRTKSITKGQKLLHSFHVSNVREEIYNEEGYRRILGTVLRETPGVESRKKNDNCYQVTIELNADRTVGDTVCGCKGGKGYCKHAAAVCIFVNVENTCSKTDVPMMWNKPSEAQLEKYAKGRRIEQMFKKTVDSRNPSTRTVYRIDDVENVTEEHQNFNYSMSKMLAAEKKCASERENRERIRVENEEKIRGIVDQLFEQLSNNSRESFHAYESSLSDLTLKLKSMQCPAEYSAVYSLIEVNKSKWVDICVNSIGQSQSAVWHAERYLRITCSSKVHRIKTRKDNFEGLAKQFKNDKYRGTLTDDMRYGIETEPIAKSAFESITGLKVHEVGLVVSLDQPFLACSPDGIIIENDEIHLLEIKCPSSCKDSGLIDTLTKEIRVPYLKLNEEGQVVLKKSHVYFTQVQVSMYIIRSESCHFFVYSKSDYIYVLVNRDDEFLREVIPKAEHFFYRYFLPLLTNYVTADY